MAEEGQRLALRSSPIQLINQVLSGWLEHGRPAAHILKQLLKLHEEKLKNCHDPYPVRSSTSRGIVQSGRVTLKDGETVTLSSQRQENVIRISDAFNLDELDSLVIWLQFLDQQKHSPTTASSTGREKPARVLDTGDGSEMPLDEDSFAKLTAFYFEERRSISIAVITLLHIGDNESSPIFSTCLEFINLGFSPETASLMLRNFIKRTQALLPEAVRGSPRKATVWAKQLMCEQKLLLEVVFLLLYGRTQVNAHHYLAALSALKETSWGQSQGCLAYFDEETCAMNQDVSNLLSLITLQVSHIEEVISATYHLPPEPPPAHTLSHPSRLKEIHDLQLLLLQLHPRRARPIALAWTLVLHKMTTIYMEEGVPPSHVKFAELILPSQNNDLQGEDAETNPPEDSLPLYQRWARHILSSDCQVFSDLGQLATSAYSASSAQRSGSPESNALGYLVTVRILICAIPTFFRLSYLGNQTFEEAVNALGMLLRFDRRNAIATEFWRTTRGELANVSEVELPLASGEAEYLEVARSRFPLNCRLFTRLCRSLSGFGPNKPGLAFFHQSYCAESLAEYVDQLATLTEALPNSQSAVSPLVIEPTSPPEELLSQCGSEDQGWVKATRPVAISPSIQVPRGTLGKVVSEMNQKPLVVCWYMTWSAWEYWGNLVFGCASYPSQQNSPKSVGEVFGSSVPLGPSWADGRLDSCGIVDVLEMLTGILECNPNLGSVLIRRMVGRTSHQILVQAIFNLIENSIDAATNTCNEHITQSSLRLVSALLPIFPEAVWPVVRGSQILFPTPSQAKAWNAVESTRSFLKFERLSGHYSITMAVLDLAHMLVSEATVSGLTTSQTLGEIKTEVVLQALQWVCEEVWPGFQSWKYLQLEYKYKIAHKCCAIFNAIASEALRTHLHPLPALKSDLVIARMIQSFVHLFLVSQTAITLNPMITVIANDMSVVEILRNSGRDVELDAFIESLASCLTLAKNLLSLRPSCLPLGQACLLERLLLTQAYPKSSWLPDAHENFRHNALPFIAQWSLHGPLAEIARDSCDIFSLLCILSKDWPSHWPSISSGFGNPSNISQYLQNVARQGSLVKSDDSSGLRPTFWNLLAVILETQPSLEAILVTGTTMLPGSTLPIPSQKLIDTPLQLGIKCFVECFDDNNEIDLPVGLSVSHFLHTVFACVNGFAPILHQTIADQTFVSRIISISTSPIIPPDSLKLREDRPVTMKNSESNLADELSAEDFQVKHFCNELICKSYSTQILTVLLQLEKILEPSSAQPNQRHVEKTLLGELHRTPDRLSELVLPIIETMANPTLQSEALRDISNRFSHLDLDSYRRVECVLPYEKLRLYGKGFVYDYELVKSRVEGTNLSPEMVTDVLESLVAINWNLSAVDAQLEVTRAWQKLLEVTFEQKHIAAQLERPLSKTLLASADAIADETRGGDFMVHIHSIRISILLTLLQPLPINSETAVTTIKLLENVKNIATSERFSIIASIKQRLKATWHTDFLKFVYMTLRRCTSIDVAKLQDDQRHLMFHKIETLLRSCISILETVLTLALLTEDSSYQVDVSLSVSIFSELMNSPVRPPIMNWVHCIHDLSQPAFNLLKREIVAEDHDLQFAEDIIRLFMSLAFDDRLAEYLASEGLIPVLLNLPWTHLASHGLIEPVLPHRTSERNPTHQLWCSVLALVTSLANTLCYSELFMLDEIGSFARLYSPQLLRALTTISVSDRLSHGSYGMSLTLAGIEEMELVTSLLLVISSKPFGKPRLNLPENYRTAMLSSLQTLAHCLNHPNSTAKWLESDVSWKSGHMMTVNLSKLSEKPRVVMEGSQGLAPHVQEALLRMFQTARNILQALIAYTRALNVITGDAAEWALEYAVMSPTRSIVAGEPATIGTLFELAETSLDSYRLATNQDPDLACIDLCTVSSVVLESSLLLASTQLALWLCSAIHSSNWQSGDFVSSSNPSKDVDVNLASSPRLKREILSDLAPDLVASIDKALSMVQSLGPVTRESKETPLRSSQFLRQSMTSRKKKSLLWSSTLSASTQTTSTLNANKGDQMPAGLEALFSALKTFTQRFLSSVEG